MIYIFQDSLSGNVLGVFNNEINKLDKPEVGAKIDLRQYIDSGSEEKVEVISIGDSKFGEKSQLVQVKPSSYKGIDSENSMYDNQIGKGFIYKLEDIILDRKARPSEASFTSSLLYKGMNLIGSTLVNQAVETVLEAKDNKKQSSSERAADLLYHLVILLSFNDIKVAEVEAILHKRHRKIHGS